MRKNQMSCFLTHGLVIHASLGYTTS